MKNFKIVGLFLLATVILLAPSCKRRKNTEEFLKTTCLIAKEVRENGTVVYVKGGNSVKSGYSKFKLEANLPNKTGQITEIDGTVTKGSWTFANSTISFTGLNPALTDNTTGTASRTTATYNVVSYSAKSKEIVLKANDVNLKSGNVTVEYTMVPCE